MSEEKIDVFQKAILAAIDGVATNVPEAALPLIEKLKEIRAKVASIEAALKAAQDSMSNMYQQRERAVGSVETIMEMVRGIVTDEIASQMLTTPGEAK